MSDSYKTVSTSSTTAKVNDIVISENSITRRVLRPELIDNAKSAEACVKIAIVHQRKKPNDGFEDIEATPLSTLKAGEMMKLQLDTAETLNLHKELIKLFAIYQEKGIMFGENEIVVGFSNEMIKTTPGRAQVISALLEQGHSEEIWKRLVELQPNLADQLCMIQTYEKRKKALDEFENSMGEDKDESFWQHFFEEQSWIFGYGLNYKFLNTIDEQPNYGGTTVRGDGAQRGDFFTSSSGNVCFTVLVEVKKPNTMLLTPRPYRNASYPPSVELSGGVSQLQNNCRTWEVEGSRTESNREIMTEQGINTVSPKGILVIGNLSQLEDNSKKTSFELYRRNLTNPEVITFDELLERAKFIVEHQKADAEKATTIDVNIEEDQW